MNTTPIAATTRYGENKIEAYRAGTVRSAWQSASLQAEINHFGDLLSNALRDDLAGSNAAQRNSLTLVTPYLKAEPGETNNVDG